MLRALAATSNDMPPLENFPKAHQVAYKYYRGVIYFLEEDYAHAEEELEQAYAMCTTSESKNRQLILTYLIPTKMITKHQLLRALFWKLTLHLQLCSLPFARLCALATSKHWMKPLPTAKLNS